MSIGDSPEQDVERYLCFGSAGMRRCDTEEFRKCEPQFVKAEDYDRLKARCQELERNLVKVKARYVWCANELLACDYGDNTRSDIGWIVWGWRKKNVANMPHNEKPRIYGDTIDDAVDDAIYEADLLKPQGEKL